MRSTESLAPILLVAVAFLLVGCGGGTQQEQPGEGAGETMPVEEGAVVVTMRETSFVQSRISVPPGTTVRWINEDSFAHTVTSTEPEGLFDSGSVAAGESFEFTFGDTGEVAYVCEIHPSMTGSVLVVEGGGATVLEGAPAGGGDDGAVY